MKKKIAAIILGLFSLFVLAACSSDNLDGEYYWVRAKDDLQVELTIDGNTGKYNIDSYTYPVKSIDREKKQFVVDVDGKEYIVYYNLKEDGEIILDGSSYGGGLSSDIHLYKKDSEGLKKAIEKE